jgi:uncharacterized protein YceK
MTAHKWLLSLMSVAVLGCGQSSESGRVNATSPTTRSIADPAPTKWPGPPLAALDTPFTIVGDLADRPKTVPTLSVDRAWSIYLANFGDASRDYDQVATTKRTFVYLSFTAPDGVGKLDSSDKTVDRIVDRPALALITTGIPCQKYGPKPAPGSTAATVPKNIGAKNVVFLDGATGAILDSVEQCGFPLS